MEGSTSVKQSRAVGWVAISTSRYVYICYRQYFMHFMQNIDDFKVEEERSRDDAKKNFRKLIAESMFNKYLGC